VQRGRAAPHLSTQPRRASQAPATGAAIFRSRRKRPPRAWEKMYAAHPRWGAQLRQQPATAPLAQTIEAIAGAGLVLAEKLRRARLEDVIGEAGAVNVQGEAQQKLDVLADDLLREKLSRCPEVAAYASEEQAQPQLLGANGCYCVLSDPLDGSSNIDVAVPVGTIFGVLPCGEGFAPEAALLQPGRALLCAGYLLYGSSTVLVLASAAGGGFVRARPRPRRIFAGAARPANARRVQDLLDQRGQYQRL